MNPLIGLLGLPGVEAVLSHLSRSSESAYSPIYLEDFLLDLGASEPQTVLDQLISENLLQHIGEKIGISKNGRKVRLLLDAIEGADIESTCQRLLRIEGQQSYQLVREGMTTSFFKGLTTTPDRLGTLYICSPWINAGETAIKHLRYAFSVSAASSRLPELFVITRPPRRKTSKNSLAPFQELGAKVFLNTRLHTKLYIREPNQNGGFLMAVVGSQNLTRSKYLELGIQINGDDQLIRQLIRYFMELINSSQESN